MNSEDSSQLLLHAARDDPRSFYDHRFDEGVGKGIIRSRDGRFGLAPAMAAGVLTFGSFHFLLKP